MNRCAAITVGGLVAVASFLLQTGAAQADGSFALDGNALSKMSFEGVDLPTTSKALLEKFPSAQLEERKDEQKQGMTCYLVTDFPGTDKARFYYCDDRLYQFEASYSLERLEKMGGARSLLTRLIKTWGPVDHAGESRWTWQRPMYSRRADFYAWPDRAKLTITELGLMPVVTARRNEPIEPAIIPGF